MTDRISIEKRSENMSRIRGKDTRPELLVRKTLHGKGLRYRLHSRKLPGRPDLIFPQYRTVLFIHGCFWHQHAGCKKATIPKTNPAYWEEKFRRNAERDKKAVSMLESAGWKVIIVWECEIPRSTADPFWEDLATRIRSTEAVKPPSPKIEH